MKIKELIRKLKEFDENLTIVGLTENGVYSKDPELKKVKLLVKGTEKTIPYIAHEEDHKGKYLILDFRDSDFYVYGDFNEQK